MLQALRRRAAARRELTPTEEILDSLLDREEIIDRFDATYLDDLHEILRELHGLTDENLAGHALGPNVARLWELSGRTHEELRLSELGGALASAGCADPDRYSPKHASMKVQRKYKHTDVTSFDEAAGKRVIDDPQSGSALVNKLQRDYSVQQGGATEVDFHDLGRPETGDPWSPFMIKLREEGLVSGDEPVLTIGPRWVGEIVYFREKLGLRGTIGLDLFSHDESLVKVGDMHNMPFEDNTFGLVYQRNTFDKSYDIRTALRECLRVLRNGGILISDDCYAYTDGVSDISRTSIKHNRQLVRVLEPHVESVLYDVEARAEAEWIERVGQVAIKVRK